MDSRRPILRLLVAAAALVVTASACSSCDEVDTASAPASPEPAASAPATQTPASPAPAETPGQAPTEAPPPADEAGVTIEGFDYEVPETVEAGSEVMVVNNDREAHTFTLRGTDVQLVVQGGASGSFTAPEAGTYEVVCDFHGGMTAELVVA
jgi:plastocyanin